MKDDLAGSQAPTRPTVYSASEAPNQFPQVIRLRSHTFRADVGEAKGSTDSAPGPHDFFDAALAACKTLTATWYARRNQIPLESVEAVVVRDDAEEAQGRYHLTVQLAFRGPLSDEQRTKLYAAVARCPIHKLMTTTEVTIVTEPLVASL